jgi:hypothetical protein
LQKRRSPAVEAHPGISADSTLKRLGAGRKYHHATHLTSFDFPEAFKDLSSDVANILLGHLQFLAFTTEPPDEQR